MFIPAFVREEAAGGAEEAWALAEMFVWVLGGALGAVAHACSYVGPHGLPAPTVAQVVRQSSG